MFSIKIVVVDMIKSSNDSFYFAPLSSIQTRAFPLEFLNISLARLNWELIAELFDYIWKPEVLSITYCTCL